MTWTWLTWAYTFCLTVGTLYTVLAFFLGHFGGDHGGDHGGGDGHVGGDGAQVGADNALHFPLLSPVVIAIFFTAFGAGGIIGGELLKDRHPAWTIAPALGGGLVFALSMAAVMAWIFRKTVGSSHAREIDVIGAEATVAITIPPGGIGKIVYEAAGTRFTGSARSGAGTEIRQDAKVTIRSREGPVYVVDVK